MAFFIRKSFSTGPIRFNLSKSGVGLSGGIKGARIGSGPRGSYVHGGRYGLYYRERLGSSSKSKRSNKQTSTELAPDSFSKQTIGSQEEFVDTGATYPAIIQKSESQYKLLPERPEKSSSDKIYFGLSILLLFLAGWTISKGQIPTFSGTLFLILLLIGMVVFLKNRKIQLVSDELKKDEEAIDLSQDEEKGLQPKSVQEELTKLSSKLFTYYSSRAGIYYTCAYCNNKLDSTNYKRTIRNLKISDKILQTINTYVFQLNFNHYTEDNILDSQEEDSLNDILNKLSIPEDDIRYELNTIKRMSDIRRLMENELSEITTDINLKKDEKCFYQSEAKLLKSKILKTQTIDGVKYKSRGFEVDREGTLYITNSRVLLVGSGEYSIKLDKVIEHTLNFDENLAELIIDGRQSSLFFTLPNTATFSTILENVIGIV